MKHFQALAWIGLGMLAMMSPLAKADVWDQKTDITFGQPVEIPGQVLPPGTYVFKLMDSLADRNIVEVFNKDETHLYGTFLAIPDYRLHPTGKPIITFEERASGAPEAVRAWFYPGDTFGHEFVYPKVRAVELAKRTNQPVASMPSEMAANTTKPAKTMTEPHVMAMKKAPIKVQKPSGEEAQTAEVFGRAPAQPAQVASAKTPEQLPKTASPLPLLGLIGFLSLGAAFSLRAVAKRID